MKDKLKKHQELESPARRVRKLSKGAQSKRERSTRLVVRKPAGRDVRRGSMEKLDIHDAATSPKQTDLISKEDVYTGHERLRYASLREVSPNNSTGKVF